MNALLAQLAAALQKISAIVKARMPAHDPQPANDRAQRIYNEAVALMGTDASPADIAPDSLACAETVNRIVALALGTPIGGGTSTYSMWQVLRSSTQWLPIILSDALPGDIIISPTGSITNARLEHGHVGIVAKHGILSNNSENGLLSENYDIDSWRRYYTQFGGLPTFCYRAVQ